MHSQTWFRTPVCAIVSTNYYMDYCAFYLAKCPGVLVPPQTECTPAWLSGAAKLQRSECKTWRTSFIRNGRLNEKSLSAANFFSSFEFPHTDAESLWIIHKVQSPAAPHNLNEMAIIGYSHNCKANHPLLTEVRGFCHNNMLLSCAILMVMIMETI